jgi:hypothetical protein
MVTPYFFLDSDSPFNCLNDSIKVLLSYIRKFLRKKILKLEKINFITNKNKSKNQVGKSNSQMLLSISFVCVHGSSEGHFSLKNFSSKRKSQTCSLALIISGKFKIKIIPGAMFIF